MRNCNSPNKKPKHFHLIFCSTFLCGCWFQPHPSDLHIAECFPIRVFVTLHIWLLFFPSSLIYISVLCLSLNEVEFKLNKTYKWVFINHQIPCSCQGRNSYCMRHKCTLYSTTNYTNHNINSSQQISSLHFHRY